MGGWVGGWVSGWVGEWVGGWMGGWMGGWIGGRVVVVLRMKDGARRNWTLTKSIRIN